MGSHSNNLVRNLNKWDFGSFLGICNFRRGERQKIMCSQEKEIFRSVGLKGLLRLRKTLHFIIFLEIYTIFIPRLFLFK